jgi:undecaprenyl-diphosphatase
MSRTLKTITILLILFVALAAIVAAGWTSGLDYAVTTASVAGRTAFLSDVARNVTALGSDPIVILLSLLVLGYCIAAGQQRFIPALLGTPTAFLVGTLVKGLVARPRPEVALIALPDSYSFPSGHAVAASAFYLSLALLASDAERRAAPRRLIIGAGVLVALLVAWSRVYLGVHYFSDVIGGLLLGSLGAVVAVRMTGVATVPAA